MTNAASGKPFQKKLIQALKGVRHDSPPIWLMRQAGRYLPEYREVRAQYPGFLDLVYDPRAAAEVTLQPIRRFGMDGAILFSDILTIPHALGQSVQFEEGRGPVLEPIRSPDDLPRLNRQNFETVLEPVYHAAKEVRSMLTKEGFNDTALIGFSGSPWTLACYMIEGGSSKDYVAPKLWAYSDPLSFGELINTLTTAVTDYLLAQIAAGAEAVQLFDSWSGMLDHTLFARWVIGPTRRIADEIKKHYPDIPLIGFARGCGRMAMDYAQSAGLTAISLDPQTSPRWASGVIQSTLPVQGNLDPVCLLAGGLSMATAVEDILVHLSKGPFVFNLGHGIIKETPIEHVEELVGMVRDWK